jgi:PAS domain S-box-containing protein
MKLPFIRPITQTVLPYILFAGLWIALSDRVLEALTTDPQILARWSTYKGWFFVVVTALLLADLLRFQLRARQKTEIALRESLERFEIVARATNDAVWDWNLQTNAIWWSESFQTLFGDRAVEIEPTIESWENRLHPQDKARVIEGIRAHIQTGGHTWSDEYRFRRRDGSYAFVYDRGYVLRNGQGQATRMIGAIQDITARKQAEDELHELSGQLMKAQDEERRRLARELHDTTVQTLAAQSMMLVRLQRDEARLADESRALLAEALACSERAARELRSFSYLLHPPLLDELGLAGALRDYAEGFSRRTEIKVETQIEFAGERLPPDIELALFRIVQESLGNVLRHSGSPSAIIRLARKDAHVLLEITDRGRGLGAAKAQRAAGVGLAGMRERLRQLGGRLEMKSTPQGTTVQAIVPMRGTTDESGVEHPDR